MFCFKSKLLCSIPKDPHTLDWLSYWLSIALQLDSSTPGEHDGAHFRVLFTSWPLFKPSPPSHSTGPSFLPDTTQGPFPQCLCLSRLWNFYIYSLYRNGTTLWTIQMLPQKRYEIISYSFLPQPMTFKGLGYIVALSMESGEGETMQFFWTFTIYVNHTPHDYPVK